MAPEDAGGGEVTVVLSPAVPETKEISRISWLENEYLVVQSPVLYIIERRLIGFIVRTGARQGSGRG